MSIYTVLSIQFPITFGQSVSTERRSPLISKTSESCAKLAQKVYLLIHFELIKQNYVQYHSALKTIFLPLESRLLSMRVWIKVKIL